MSDSRKYYYLKLKDDFFESDALVILESMPDGHKYSNILLKLYLRSLKDEGRLLFNNRIPYNAGMLAQITRHSVGDVEKAIALFKELELMEVLDNGAIFMLDIQNFIGQSSTEADRIRAYRKRIADEKEGVKPLDTKVSTNVRTNVQDLPYKRTPEIEIEIEREIDIEIDTETEKKSSSGGGHPLKELSQFYQNNFGMLSQHVMQDMEYWVQDIGFDLVMEALKRANEAQKNYNYAKGIMKKWAMENVKTLDDVAARDVAHANKQKQYQKQPMQKEQMPASFKQQVVDEPVQEDADIKARIERLEKLKQMQKNGEDGRHGV